ncbi:hypothetical protein BMR1_02g00556 [Babesia microti strain RI]|uniref:Uncharacterized protein n=1 Tax=Babesia microti (strain RI) TaxID=1133968 RepID=A0A1R4AA00_BABMR|nr:hypothetical protein BMR1_02g00556 [Babesia microti strain RI]SJK85819.1 hypothetical protein BMR1_02g00556 [Babesia microti strain RI]|eukprot:XP_021338038.1 hypothetical protein BMR1_02g00556 [Babesia microti strain RI]
MAKQSEKKRALREEKLTQRYKIAMYFSMISWILVNLLRKTPINFTNVSRFIVIYTYYFIATSQIFKSLDLGVPFSIWNDLFIVTFLSQILSIFTPLGYKLLYIVPFYLSYKGFALLYNWCTEKPPLDEHLCQKKQQKQKVKYIRH